MYVIFFCTLEKFVVSQKTFVYMLVSTTHKPTRTHTTLNNVLVSFVPHFALHEIFVYALYKEIMPKVMANSAKTDFTCVVDIKG